MLVGVMAVISVFATLILTQPKEVKVPNVAKLDVAAAKLALKDAGFKVGDVIEMVDKNVAEGKVVKTNPEAGASRKEGAAIDIYVSRGGEIVQLDDYTGLTEQEAREEIKGLGIDADKVVEIRTEKDDSVDKGLVIKQSPGEGAKYQIGSGDKIVLTISQGAETVTMPDLTNQDFNAAIAQLKTLGIPAANITTVAQETLDKTQDGFVTGQTPSAGELIKLKSTQIVIYYYKFNDEKYESSSREEASKSESISKSEAAKESSSSSSSASGGGNGSGGDANSTTEKH
jgi:serine/threonine-protein kinase